MNLEKIKELEDTKNELSILGNQYNNLFMQKKSKYVLNAHEDFKNFFKNKGFTIKESERDIEASYGQARVIIEKAKVEDSYIGAYSIWKMKCLIDNSNYRIVLNKLNHYPTITTTFGTTKKLTEEEKLDNDIQKTKESIEDIKKCLDEFSTIKFGYGLIREDELKLGNKYPQFESIKDLLGSMFN